MTEQHTVGVWAQWTPIAWGQWQSGDTTIVPARIPEEEWLGHVGHDASMKHSALGCHGLRCRTCGTEWEG